MNRQEIVALAEKAGFERLFPGVEDWVCFTEEIERFYKMVVAAERDAFAKESSATEQPAQQQQGPKRWAVFCSQCQKEWSVSYPHPGKSICAECDAKVGAQQQEPDK